MRWLCRGSVFSSFRAVGVELTAAIYSRWKSSIRHRWMWKDFRLVIKGPRSAWNYFGLFERIHHSMSIRIYLIWGWLHMSVHHHCPPPHEIASGAWSSLSSEVVGAGEIHLILTNCKRIELEPCYPFHYVIAAVTRSFILPQQTKHYPKRTKVNEKHAMKVITAMNCTFI